VAYVRTVPTASGARAVQIVWSTRRGSRRIEHLGSAHTPEEVEALRAVGKQRIEEGQAQLDLGLEVAAAAGSGGPLEIINTRMGHLWDALCRAYDALGFDAATSGDEVFGQLVLARIVEPTSKEDSIRVVEEVGIKPASYPTIKRRLPLYAKPEWRQAVSGAAAGRAALGPASLVLYDVTTLYFETDQGDGFRESGFSKERRLEPQITLGLLTDAAGFPLQITAFEGNKAETQTMVPVIEAFKTAHGLEDVTVVADAGMISAGNQQALEAPGSRSSWARRSPRCPTW
jgi:DDE family transposase